jgi:hypothetical protein
LEPGDRVKIGQVWAVYLAIVTRRGTKPVVLLWDTAQDTVETSQVSEICERAEPVGGVDPARLLSKVESWMSERAPAPVPEQGEMV